MATGTELFLGFPHAKIPEVLVQLGLTVNWITAGLEPESGLEELNEKLARVYVTCLRNDLKFGIKKENTRRIIVETPLGQREMSPWRLDLEYDPREMGEEPEHAILGVSLISRYFPRFLDWRTIHGGSGDPIILDTETLSMIGTARTAITAVLPPWKDASICIKEIFY